MSFIFNKNFKNGPIPYLGLELTIHVIKSQSSFKCLPVFDCCAGSMLRQALTGRCRGSCWSCSTRWTDLTRPPTSRWVPSTIRLRIRIRTIFGGWIWIRIRVKSWIWIRIKVKIQELCSSKWSRGGPWMRLFLINFEGSPPVIRFFSRYP
jgi:hypothetical protein